LRPVTGDHQSEREALPPMSLEAIGSVTGTPSGRGDLVRPLPITNGSALQPSAPILPSPVSTAGRDRTTALLVEVRDDLGFDTVSLYVRGPDEWRLLERQGPERAWHGVLDPSLFDGTGEAVEYADVRAIPGVGPRLAGLGCSSVAMLPLPNGGRVLFDSEAPCRPGGWIERARPYLALISTMAGPAWPVGGSLASHQEMINLDRLFTACREVLERTGSTIEDLLRSVKSALHADELFLISDRGADLQVLTPDVGPYPRRLSREQMPSAATAEPGLSDGALAKLALSLGMSSRALAGAFGRQDGDSEALVAGWAEGPALSPVTMAVAARTVSTARTGVQGRRQAVTSLLDRERTRMAYALHDGLTQTVAGAILELEALAKRIERDPAEALRVLESSKTEIRRALAELRGMLFDLSQTSDEQRGPSEPLTTYVDDVVKRWRLPARVAVEGDLTSVPARVLSVAYVVIREALANAAKHAAGRNVTVTLSAGHDDLTVIVGDGGRGFTRHDELVAREANHIGLDMLRRRVGEVGGKLRVESRPGKGTRVIAQLPIHEVAS
jgi:signal transduction histidine kinase